MKHLGLQNKVMAKKLHREIPIDYAACQQQDCPRTEKCLHQIACRPLIEQPTAALRLLNPILCARDGAYPYFRDSTPVTYARGFTGMQSRMFPVRYQQFMPVFVSHFGRNPYFERQRGGLPLSPRK